MQAKKKWYTFAWLGLAFKKVFKSKKPQNVDSQSQATPAPGDLLPNSGLAGKKTEGVQAGISAVSEAAESNTSPKPTAIETTKPTPTTPTNPYDSKDSLKPNNRDIVIVVMGPTGVGKTTFVNYFADTYPRQDVGHHGLDAGTKDVTITSVEFEGSKTGGRLVLVDTPGFDDPGERPNSEVLKCVARYLKDAYTRQQAIDGIVYLHRITDIRFDAGANASLNIFKSLYGAKGYDRLALITTMWNDIHPSQRHKFVEREDELKASAWAAFLNREDGAIVSRYDATDDETTKKSSERIILDLLKNALPRQLRLQLQEELMVKNMSLPMSAAGKAAFTLTETAMYYLSHQRI
ncbi:hypothetical protein CVT24_009430 [Panaeolus cyanescens]|uniref:Septin-type G domain-containing protein n=1 Tax=Panaeolus cyanescens TaxID=181874 RepID=A0A409WCJ8_9AGAR|nr:hypothetical protein CVT24_009430 [Panaeolus cyanescens]